MTLICLISGQLMPNLFSVILLKPEEVILVHTIDSKEEALFFSEFIQKQKYGVSKTTLLEVRPFNPEEIRNSASELMKSIREAGEDPGSYTLNYTAGTKPMSIEFVNVFKQAGARLLYIDTQQETCWWTIDGKIEERPLEVKLNVPEVFSLNRGAILDQEQQPIINTLSNLTYCLFEKRAEFNFENTDLGKWIKDCVHLQLEIAPWNKSEKLKSWNPTYRDGRLVVTVDPVKTSQVTVEFDGIAFEFKKKEFWLNYFTGGWFEQYVFLVLGKTGVYDDIRCNIRLKTTGVGDPHLKNELDVVAVKNGIPVFVECKTGLVNQKSVTNLKTAAEVYGGKYGEAVLCSLSKGIAPAVLERISDNGIVLICGIKQIENELPAIHEYMVIKK